MRRRSYAVTEHGYSDNPEFLRVEYLNQTTDKFGNTINARVLDYDSTVESGDPWTLRADMGILVHTLDGEDPTAGDRAWVMWCADTSHWEEVASYATSGYKQMCRFTLDSTLTTATQSVAATIQSQYGRGTDHSSTSITVYNLLTHTAGTYVFEGGSGDAGLAFYDEDNDKWYIVQMECP